MRIGGAELFHKAVNRKGAPRWRGPAKILDIDDAGVTVKFQSQTFEEAQYCVREKVEGKDVEGAEWGPASSQSRPM